MATIKPVKFLKHDFKQLMNFAALGKRPRLVPGDTKIAVPAKQNIPDATYINAGAAAIEVTGDTPLPVSQQARCAGPDPVYQYMSSRGLNWSNISPGQLEELAQTVYAGGAFMFTSQMNERGGRPDSQTINVAEPKSNWVEKRVAELCAQNNLHYFGSYDGELMYTVIDRDSLNPATHLASDAGILTMLRSLVPFGKLGFIEHTLSDGSSYLGAAEYRDVSVKTYIEQSSNPAGSVAGTAFAMMACKRGLQALADLTSDNARKTKILSRKVLNFGWLAFWEQASKSIELRTPVPGLTGYQSTSMLIPGSFRVGYGSTIVSLVESPWFYSWEDGERFGLNPAVLQGYGSNGRRIRPGQVAVSKNGYVHDSPQEGGEVPAGYFGPESITSFGGPTSGVYLPGYEAAWPQRALGLHDIPYAALDMLGILRGWVGESTSPTYLSCWATGDSAYCDNTNVRRYVYDRYKAGRSWGYVWYNSVTQKGAVLYCNYNLKPSQSESPKFMVGGQEYTVTEAIYGSFAHGFLFDNSTVS